MQRLVGVEVIFHVGANDPKSGKQEPVQETFNLMGELIGNFIAAKSRTLHQERRVCSYRSRNCISFGFIPCALMYCSTTSQFHLSPTLAT